MLHICKAKDIAKSPAELVEEGNALSHCVGRMNYDQKMLREEGVTDLEWQRELHPKCLGVDSGGGNYDCNGANSL